MGKSILFILVTVLMFGCSNDQDQNHGELSKLDTSNAKGFYISQGSRTKSAGEEANKLFKITNDGYVQEVTILDEGGNEIKGVESPSDLIKLSDEYLILIFGGSDVYLVRISDGAAFVFGDSVPRDRIPGYPYLGEDFSKTGDSFIFISAENKLVKLDTSDPKNLTVETYSALGDEVSSFCADINGNLAYYGYDSGSNQILRYRKENGGFETLPGDPNMSHTTYWTNLNDDTMYYYNASLDRRDQNTNKLTAIGLKEINPSPFELVDYGNTDLENGCGFKNLLKIRNKDRIVALGGCGYIYDLYNPNKEARNISAHEIFDLTSIKFGSASDNFYYVVGQNSAGKSVLIKVDPIDDSYELLVNGQYDIYKMDVSPNDEIVFNALRLNDGKIIIGEINQSGTINIIDETLENQVLVLEKIN